VIAKAGQFLGGSDIDQWLLAEILSRCGISPHNLGSDYAPLLAKCEQAKITLSKQPTVEIVFEVAGKLYDLCYTRDELEALLTTHGFYAALRRSVDKVLVIARQRGIFKEDIQAVLLVGGTSLIPSVQANLQAYFPNTTVYAHKPFTAVVEGALQVAAGYGLQDYLVHSYGLRHLTEAGEHEYDEIIPMGSAYPGEPVEVILGAAFDRQKEVEFVIGEIDTDAVMMIEVQYQDGQAVFVAQADRNAQQVIPLNEQSTVIARLNPVGKLNEERLKAVFQVDENRLLHVTVTDLKNQKMLLDRAALTLVR
ncbi:MAG: Hsp70 family protein, partial [Anaerolineae bacterium]|nr:Hsp70 family protein [Anaerolineae bacterium]